MFIKRKNLKSKGIFFS